MADMERRTLRAKDVCVELWWAVVKRTSEAAFREPEPSVVILH